MYRTILAALAATTFATTALANSACPVIGALAESVMLNRQAGISMSVQMEAAATVGEPGDQMREMLSAIIMDAYAQPRWNTPGSQQRAVEDFRNDVESICYTETSR
jgi:hypothetical protein